MYQNYKATELEPQILAYWEEHQTIEKLRKKNAKGKKFYFLDGPPYTSGKFHMGHAWNYALKDIALRYKRATGFKVWDRNGFDVHGLPTEHKVMEKYNLKTKEDIQAFGVDKFITECEKFCLDMAQIMTKDLIRMGVTVDTSNPYMALKTEFMEGEWDLIKKAYETKHLYYGEKVLTWCQHCETAVAKHECEYQNVKENSIFVKFPIKNKKDEYIIIWTTTPWTIPFNLAVMAGPEIDYVKVDVGTEKWILAKALAGVVVQAVAGIPKFKIIEEFKGEKLEGLEYVHPFDKYIPQLKELKKKHPRVHTVILSEKYVDTSAGTGLVHAAPGCGPEDHEACKPYDIPPFNSLKENGFFPEGMGKFSGIRAKVEDTKFIEALKEEGILIEITEVEHEYPHCWRCHNPVIFRITYQWFFKVEDLSEKILKGNKKVHWVPDSANKAYESWVRNLRDNSITRQRYWGTPVPIWKCAKCQKVKVIGSRQELRENGGKVPDNLHIPWIDEVELNCSGKGCSGAMKRVPDVIDVWVDAGTTSWNCLDNDAKKMTELYPADLILEAKEQTRLWFSMLSICSYIYRGDNAFKNVYVYGMLNDLDGQKMSKSLGNIISPYQLIDKHGVDVLRYYMCQNNAGEDINFNWDECANKERTLNVLWNVHKLLLNLASEVGTNPFELDSKAVGKFLAIEEKYILSKLHSTLKQVTELMEAYRFDEAIGPMEALFLELSRTYIQMVREKMALGEQEEKEACLYTISQVLFETLKMFSIIVPFVSEAIYLNLKEAFGLKEESISHYAWPKADAKKINVELEQQVAVGQSLIQAALNAREKMKLGVRWPVKELVVVSADKEIIAVVKGLHDVLKNQINVKEIKVLSSLPGMKVSVKPDGGKIGPVYGGLSPQIILRLTSDSPETILSHIQKECSYNFDIDGKPVKITKEMIIVKHEVPNLYVESAFQNGYIYLNTQRTPELEAEGYARELTRHIQQSRKEAGLQKKTGIVLFVKANLELKPRLEPFKKDIADKVGANKIEISTIDPVRKHHHTYNLKIKEETFKIWFDAV